MARHREILHYATGTGATFTGNAVDVFRVALATNGDVTAGSAEWSISVYDDTNNEQQSLSGDLSWSAVRDGAGVYVGDIDWDSRSESVTAASNWVWGSWTMTAAAGYATIALDLSGGGEGSDCANIDREDLFLKIHPKGATETTPVVPALELLYP